MPVQCISNKIFCAVFTTLFALWLFIISSLRVFDVTFDDKLSLLSRMPVLYVFALFVLASFCLLSFYFGSGFWSAAFAGLFALYFYFVPWLVEPLRIIDTFWHFSRVPVVIDRGYIPTFERYYFQYPGSTVWGAAVLSVTGMDSFLFVKFFFPFLSMTTLYIGFFCLTRRITGSSLPVGPSLLLLYIFGYGGYHFSPIWFAWMIIPILLYSAMRLGTAFLLCFIFLSASLVISHPTTSAFLLVVFLMLILLFQAWKKKPYTTHQLLQSRSVIFISIVFMWNAFLASRVFLVNLASFVWGLFSTLFVQTHEVPEKILQPPYPILEISMGRRIFVVLSGTLAIVILFYSLYIFIKNKTPINLRTHKGLILLPISFTLTGLLLFPLFLLSTTVFSLYYSFVFALFGASMLLGLLKIRSWKSFLFLFLVVQLLMIPSFIERYPVEQYFIMRDPIKYGMMFTGQHASRQTIVSPFAEQLYSFVDFDAWHNISRPLFTGPEFVSQVKLSDYFIFRRDGAYYAALAVERVPPEETQYFQISTALLNDSSFDLVYSSRDYLIFAKPKR